ncbi:exported hypothetical protein [Gammaproteobacteria bacterium]
MLRFFIPILLTTAFISSGTPVWAAGDEAKCRQWASEDGVPAAQIANYVRECNADQLAHPEPRSFPSDEGKSDGNVPTAQPEG